MAFLSHWLLTILLLVPVAGSATVAAVGRPAAVRWIALGTMLLAFVLSLVALLPSRWRQVAASPQMLTRAPLIPSIHLDYEVGMDGLSFPFVVLTTALFPLLCVISWNTEARSARWLATMLIFELAMLGSFLSFDFPLFYLFSIGAIVAVSELARQTGADRRAVLSLLVHLSLGACCLLVPLIGVARAGGTLDLASSLSHGPIAGSRALFVLAVIGFLFWMAIVPIHLWLPTVLSGARAPGAIAVGVFIPAIGGYGLFRVAGPLFGPAASAPWAPFATLGVASILYGGLCAMAQRSIAKFVAYSTTLVMGFVLLGFAVRTPVASGGAIILLLAQGLVVTLFFYAKDLPSEDSSGMVGLAWLTWLVAPGMLGQIIVLLGTFQAARTTPPAYGLAVAASFGVLLSGAGAARVVYRMRFPRSQTL